MEKENTLIETGVKRYLKHISVVKLQNDNQTDNLTDILVACF